MTSEHTLALLMDASGDGIYGMGIDSTCTFLNRAGAAMLGYTPDELVGRPLHNVIHHHRANGDEYHLSECKIGIAARSGKSIRVEDEVFWHKDGIAIPVIYSVNPVIVDGVNTGAVIMFTDVSHQRRAEDALHLSEERYRTLFASMDEGFSLIDIIYADDGRAIDYRLLETNSAFELQSGLQGAVGKTIVELVPDFEVEWIETYAEVARTGIPVRFESEFKSMGYWFDVFVARADSSGLISILFKDITAKKKITEDLKQSEEKVRLASNAAELGLWVWDELTDSVTWENDKTYEIFGVLKTEQPINAARFLTDVVHPDDGPAFAQAVQHTVETQARFYFEGRYYRVDTHELGWVEMTGTACDVVNGRAQGIIGTAKDISKRKRSQADLEQSEERFRSLFECMDEAFCLIEVLFNEQGIAFNYSFLKVNPAFSVHTGLRNVAGKTANELIPDLEAKWFEQFGLVAKTGEHVRFTQHSQALNKSFEIYAMQTGTPGSNHVAVIFTDITERMRADNDLRRMAAKLSELDKRKNEFLATLAHELRNPLAPISNALSLAPQMLDNPSALTKMFHMMERQVKQMVHLVDDLLDVARISTGKVELKKTRMDIQQVIALAIESSAHMIEEKGHSLRQTLPSESIYVDIDVTRMIQVISNLINNAVKYSPARSSIDIVIAAHQAHLTISIIDTGVGIKSSMLESVFNLFSQASKSSGMSEGGLGIGLSLVRKLMELHGGTVTATSGGENKGSNFTLHLPYASNASATAQPSTIFHAEADEETANNTASMRILVVDDNTDAADTLSLLLEMFGHEVAVCYDGHDALKQRLNLSRTSYYWT